MFARISLAVRQNAQQRLHGSVAAPQSAIRHNLKATRVIVYAAVFVHSRKHAAHAPHRFVVMRIGRHAHGNALRRFAQVHRLQQPRQPLGRNYARKYCPALRIKIERAALAVFVAHSAEFGKRPHVIVAVPCR